MTLWWFLPLLGCLQRIDTLMAGGNPFASPLADSHVDQPYADSPLATSLQLESTLGIDGPFATAAALDFADGVATDLGHWLLARTGASDIHEAERLLWEAGGPDPLVMKWALLLQQRDVYLREQRRFSKGVDASGPIYLHPDEAALLFAHTAWQLDLKSSLVRSPVHHYVHLHHPSTDEIRGVEPTCFWKVNALGKPQDSPERCRGVKLVFGPDHHRNGGGGFHNPNPLPEWAYQAVTRDTLEGNLIEQLAVRAPIDIVQLRARVDEGKAGAAALFSAQVRAGLDAIEQEDWSLLSETSHALHELREHHADQLPAAPDERVLEAAIATSKGQSPRRILAPVFRYYEADGPVEVPRSEAHAIAMWLDLTSRSAPRHTDWNTRIIPLMNRYRQDKERFAKLCAYGEAALASTHQSLEGLMPHCTKR